MTDVMFAHILRPVRRNQPVIAFCTGDSIARIIVGRGDHHERPPCILLSSLAWKNKNIMTVVSSNYEYCALQQSIEIAVLSAFLGSQAPLAARRGGDYVSAVKARRTPPAPRPADKPHE